MKLVNLDTYGFVICPRRSENVVPMARRHTIDNVKYVERVVLCNLLFWVVSWFWDPAVKL